MVPLSQATCERGFAAMEESHQKVIDELQRKHQRELENLHEEKERLLAEETAATIAGKYESFEQSLIQHNQASLERVQFVVDIKSNFLVIHVLKCQTTSHSKCILVFTCTLLKCTVYYGLNAHPPGQLSVQIFNISLINVRESKFKIAQTGNM